MRIIIDLDGTLCEPQLIYKDTLRRYGLATPIEPVIATLRRAKEQGAYVIVYTARRMVTHKGDVAKVIEDVGPLTEEWLQENNVPYDELVFGKPYGDYYVDDKATSILDFLSTFSR